MRAAQSKTHFFSMGRCGLLSGVVLFWIVGAMIASRPCAFQINLSSSLRWCPVPVIGATSVRTRWNRSWSQHVTSGFGVFFFSDVGNVNKNWNRRCWFEPTTVNRLSNYQNNKHKYNIISCSTFAVRREW